MSSAIRRRINVFAGLDADGGAVVDWKAVMAGRAAEGRSEPETRELCPTGRADDDERLAEAFFDKSGQAR